MSVEMVKCKLNGQFDIVLPKHRADRPEWYTEKGWERKRLDSMSKNIGEGDIVLYIGAEEGEMCALCQMWGAKVVMVEPNDKVWPNIKAIWDANKLDLPLEVYSGFCGAESSDNFVDGRYGMYNLKGEAVGEWPESAYGEVIHDHGFKELHDPDNIPIVKVDSIPVVPTVITMDVEGAEWEVLKGAEQTLKNYKPIIYLSLHPEFLFRIYEKYSYEVRQWIKELGYNEKLLEYEHEVHLVYWPIGTELAE